MSMKCQLVLISFARICVKTIKINETSISIYFLPLELSTLLV